MAGTGGGRFRLRSDGLLQTTGVPIDYEQARQHTIRVRATDPTGRSVTSDMVVAVTNVNETPADLLLEAENVFLETLPGQTGHAGKLIARFRMADPDGPAPGLVILGGNDHNWFTTALGNHLAFSPGVNFTSAWLRAHAAELGISSGYDHNGNGVLEYKLGTVTLAAQDASGARSSPFTYSVYIEDVNEAPAIITTSITLPENTPGAATFIKTIEAKDDDFTPSFQTRSFSIIGGNTNNMFSLTPAGGLYLQGKLNFNTKNYYELNIQVRDLGLTSTKVVPVHVSDSNGPPRPTGSGGTFSGRQMAGQGVGWVFANDPDPGDTASYRIVEVVDLDTGLGRVSDYRVESDGRVVSNVSGQLGWQAHVLITVEVTDSYGEFGQTTFEVVYNSAKMRPPVVLDLDGDGVELVGLNSSSVYFDMDFDGIRDRTGWVSRDDGFLALDRNGNGIIDNVGELSFASDLAGAKSDLEGLRGFDTNANGYFDSGDQQYADFQVWQDENQDGVSQANELTTLAERGIEFIRLDLDETGNVVEDASDNVLFAMSEFYRSSGSTGDVGDVFLAFESALEVNGKGKIKKIKFSGLDEATPLPDKLKKNKDKGDKKLSNAAVSQHNDTLGPVVIDLDGDGVELTSFVTSTVRFDMDNDGLRERTGWAGAGRRPARVRLERQRHHRQRHRDQLPLARARRRLRPGRPSGVR